VLRILHVISSVDPAGGGPIEGILRISTSEASISRQVDIACLDQPDAPWLPSMPLKVYPLGHKRRGLFASPKLPWNKYRVSARMVTWLIRNAARYDMVVIDGLWNFTTAAFSIALLFRNPRYVLFPHGMLDPWFKRRYPLKNVFKHLFWLFADGRVVNRANYVLFTSEEEKLLARGGFWPYRPNERVIAYGAAELPDRPEEQQAAFDRLLPALRGKPFLLFLGRIHPKKGCDLLVEAFATLARTHPEIDLVIAGPDQVGLQVELEGRIAEAGLTDRVHWTGMVEGDAKWGVLRNARAFVLPSHQENFGIAVAEALSCGVPVLISNQVNIWREVEESGGGIVKPDTQQGTNALLTEFLDQTPEQIARMGAAARTCYELHFRIQAAARELTAIAQELRQA
jgi:glycosyltransferase involved in cell wall biosynthesis